jgi:hypothetical protein
MPVEARVQEASRRAVRGRFVSERDLRVDDRVQLGVHCYIRHAHTPPAVIVSRPVELGPLFVGILEASYDSGAMPPRIYVILRKMPAE